MSRRLVLVAVIVGAIAVVAWLATRGREGANGYRPAAERGASSESTPPSKTLTTQLDAGPAAEATHPRAEPPHAAEPSASAFDPRLCVVTGRIEDEAAKPLVGVEVRIQAYRVWADGAAAPRLPGKWDLRGWMTSTDSEGRFRFEAPVPTAEPTWITVEPDEFHDSARITFGGGDRGSKPALHAGSIDLGVLTLETTGSIRGRAVDADGRAIEGADLTVGKSRSDTIGRSATSDANGAFVIAHVPAGTFGVNAQHEGHISEFRTPVTIERLRCTDVGDFRLAIAPTLRGTVVDPDGAPIAGARLWGWPASSGSGAGATSAADGTFVVYLPQVESYTLGAKRDGYDAVSDGDRSTTYAPNTSDIRIVMQPAKTFRIRVVDGPSGEPLPHFGFTVLLDNSSYSEKRWHTERRRPKPADHPDGSADVAFRIGRDLVLVAAPGHCVDTIDIDPNENVLQPYVVRLDRSASVRGVCFAGDTAAASATVELESGNEFAISPGASATFYPDKKVATDAGADGAFRFDDVDRGHYRVVIHTPSGAGRFLAPFDLKPGDELDLGRIDLEAPATITGRVVVPAGHAVESRVVRLDERRGGDHATTDHDGRFHFERVTPGEHDIRLEEALGEFAASPELHLELKSGETRDVVLDASARGVCDVRLVIQFNGRPKKGVRVSLRSGDHDFPDLGACADDGSVRKSIPVADEYRVEVSGDELGRLEHPTARIAAPLGGHVDEVVDFDVGSADFVCPSATQLPDRLVASISLTQMSRNRSWSIEIPDPPTGLRASRIDRATHCVHLEYVPAGEWDCTVEFVSADAQPVDVDLGNGRWRRKRPAVYVSVGSVSIVPGKTSRVELF